MATRTLRVIVGGMLLAISIDATAQNYPAKPIRIIVPFAAGSGADSNPRFYGDIVSRALGQPVVVDNRPGGSGVIAALAGKSAPAHGYTLFVGTKSPITLNPIRIKELPYQTTKGFS